MDAKTTVSRQKKLKKSVFLRTRILTLALVLVLALSVGGTLAVFVATGNKTPNRFASGEVGIDIVETVNGSTSVTTENKTATVTASAGGGATNKKVKLKSQSGAGKASEVVRVSFVPEVASADNANASVAFAQNWSAVQTDSTGDYISTDIVKLYLRSGWSSDWTWKDGTFYYNYTLEPGKETSELLQGVTLLDTVATSDYGTVTVTVIADAIQADLSEATQQWGCTVGDTADSDGKKPVVVS